jgi:hypothetical protein
MMAATPFTVLMNGARGDAEVTRTRFTHEPPRLRLSLLQLSPFEFNDFISIRSGLVRNPG